MRRHTSKISGDLPVMLSRLVVVLTLVMLAVGVPLEQPAAAGPDRPAPAACDWQHEYRSTLTALGENPADWTVEPLDGPWGLADLDALTAAIDPRVKCDVVSSVVKHEWIHLQQGRVYGADGATAFYGTHDRLEMAADCGARILGAVYAPYLTYVSRCPEGLQRNARYLISR